MAFSSIIQVEGVDFAQVYMHNDADTNATLGWLEDFNREFTDKRGDEPEYKFAQLLRSSSFESHDLSYSLFIGWAIKPFGVNMGQIFEYTLKKDGTVTRLEL